jgi:hypothetical protein
MADEQYVSIAQQVERTLDCPPDIVDGLSDHQKEALHAFKTRLIASLHRLYEAVPERRADEVLNRPLHEIVASLPKRT